MHAKTIENNAKSTYFSIVLTLNQKQINTFAGNLKTFYKIFSLQIFFLTMPKIESWE